MKAANGRQEVIRGAENDDDTTRGATFNAAAQRVH